MRSWAQPLCVPPVSRLASNAEIPRCCSSIFAKAALHAGATHSSTCNAASPPQSTRQVRSTQENHALIFNLLRELKNDQKFAKDAF
jgi:hypothetical protein